MNGPPRALTFTIAIKYRWRYNDNDKYKSVIFVVYNTDWNTLGVARCEELFRVTWVLDFNQ